MVERGNSEEVIELARAAGSTGGTILHGRDARSGTWLSVSMRLEPEKEVLWFLVDAEITAEVSRVLLDKSDQPDSNIVSVFALPVTGSDGLTADTYVFESETSQ